MDKFSSLENCRSYADQVKEQLLDAFQLNTAIAFVDAFAYLGAQLENAVVGAEEPTLVWIDLYKQAQEVFDKVKFDKALSAIFSYIIYCVSRNMENQTDFHRQLLIRVNALFANDGLCFQKLNSLTSHTILFIWDVVHFAKNFETQKLALLFFIHVLKNCNAAKQQELLTLLPCEKSIKNVFQNVIANNAKNLDNQIFSILNAYNETKQPPRNIITFPCAGVIIGDKYEFNKPKNCERFWININYDPWMVTFEGCTTMNSEENTTTLVKIPISEIIIGTILVEISTKGSISLNENVMQVNPGRSYQDVRIYLFDTNLQLEANYKQMLERRIRNTTTSNENSIGQQFPTTTNEKMYEKTTQKHSRALLVKENAVKPQTITNAKLKSDEEVETMQVTKLDKRKKKTTSTRISKSSHSLLDKDNAENKQNFTKSEKAAEQKLANSDEFNDSSEDAELLNSNKKTHQIQKHITSASNKFPSTIRRVKNETTDQTSDKNSYEVNKSTSKQLKTRKRKLIDETHKWNDGNVSKISSDDEQLSAPKLFKKNSKSKTDVIAETNTKLSDARENDRKQMMTTIILSSDESYDSNESTKQCYVKDKQNAEIVKTGGVDKNFKFFKNRNFHRYKIAKTTKNSVMVQTFDQYLSKRIFANEKLETLNCFAKTNYQLNKKNNTKTTYRKLFSKEKEAEYFESLQFSESF